MFDLKKVSDQLSDFLKTENYVLNKLDYSKNGKEGTLSIIVDRDSPISLEDIVEISEKISTYLDTFDPIQDAYTLDVSSLGAEKPIDVCKLANYIGQYVNLHLTHPFKGENYLEGTLDSVQNNEVSLSFFVKGRKAVAKFPESDVDKARLAIKF